MNMNALLRTYLMTLLGLLGSLALVAQQTEILNEELRDGNMPDGWSAVDVTFSTAAGGRANLTALTGVLTTPVLDLSQFESAVLIFDVAKLGTGDNGPITVEVSNDGGATFTAQTFDSPVPTNSDYLTSGPTPITALGDNVVIRFTAANSPSDKRLRDVLLIGDPEENGGGEPSEPEVELHVLANGDYALNEWSSDEAAGTYPASMLFYFSTDPGLQSYSPTNEGTEVYDCVYNATARCRVNGLEDLGFSFFNTGSAQFANCVSGDAPVTRFLGSAILGLNMSNVDYARAEWVARTVSRNDRDYGVQLQYRIGSQGGYISFDESTLYSVVGTEDGDSDAFWFELPELLLGQEEVYLRWVYYQLPGSPGGGRPEIAVDDILITTALPVLGCNDPNACNFDESATLNDGSCEYLSCCEAEAGSLAPGSTTCVQEGGEATAVVVDEPVVPEGHTLAYVLTQGVDLIIIDLSGQPTWADLQAGDYTTHTFVYPQGLDLGFVEFGQTTGFDVNELLAQGGGTICAALDVAGAAFTIENCPVAEGCTDEQACNFDPIANEDDGSCEYLSCCEAEAFAVAVIDITCQNTSGGSVVFEADLSSISILEGYTTGVVLTQGVDLVIIGFANTETVFTPLDAGTYMLHALTYPADLDLSFIEFGVTTGGDVNSLLAQGGGTLCAALDVSGTAFEIEVCIIEGCTAIEACNYNPEANSDDFSCVFIGDACDDGDPDTVNDTIDENCECVGEPVGIDEQFMAALKIYPNPVAHELIIDFGDYFEPVTVTLSDLTGRMVMTDLVIRRTTWTVDHLAPGTYVLFFESGSARGEQKVQVRR